MDTLCTIAQHTVVRATAHTDTQTCRHTHPTQSPSCTALIALLSQHLEQAAAPSAARPSSSETSLQERLRLCWQDRLRAAPLPLAEMLNPETIAAIAKVLADQGWAVRNAPECHDLIVAGLVEPTINLPYALRALLQRWLKSLR